jgi:hypothetical protein
MQPNRRNYRKEYEQRIAKAKREGRTTASGRGHPKISTRPPKIDTAERIAKAIDLMRGQKMTASKAARETHIAQETLTARLRQGAGRKTTPKPGMGRIRWEAKERFGIRTTIYVEGPDGPEVADVMLDSHNASIAGTYLAAVSNSIQQKDDSYLFDVDDRVTDVEGNSYTLVLDIDRIHDLLAISDVELFVSDKPMAH